MTHSKPCFLPRLLWLSTTMALTAVSSVQATPQNIAPQWQVSSASENQAFVPSKQVANLLTTDNSELWTENFDHLQPELLTQVSQAISYFAKQTTPDWHALDKLSYYLRIYASFGLEKNWPKGQAQALNQALVDLTQSKNFFTITATSARLHENYAVALYLLLPLEPMQSYLAQQLPALNKLIESYASQTLAPDVAVDYGYWQVIRAAGVLSYQARKINKASFFEALNQAEPALTDSLLAIVSGNNNQRNNEFWPMQNALWAIANLYNSYDKQHWNNYYQLTKAEQQAIDDEKHTTTQQQKMQQLDANVWQALNRVSSLNNEQIKHNFSVPYIVTTFRGKSACNEQKTLKNRCWLPTEQQALPINHVCSDNLYIRAQHLTQAQLEQSCTKLIAQQDRFHQILATKKQPVANDNNDKLRVVVFDDASQYNLYGQLVFDINTDNGGMYIEGTPQAKDNIASFYSYQQFWARPEFHVWNLNHEYVHYLDGRFNKYGAFGHFPSHIVWWAEGLAEYISKGNVNEKAFKLLRETKTAQRPSLTDIFATEYKDGNDRVYRWGYLAVRFMAEQHSDKYRELAQFLRQDYFDGYHKLLTESGKNYQKEFTAWLDTMKKQHQVKAPNNAHVAKHKPRVFNHYIDKTYLTPSYLVENDDHMIWQYWHANALKQGKREATRLATASE